MKCPHCYGNFSQFKYQGEFVDICDNCNGIWFDTGELSKSIEYFLSNNRSKIASSLPNEYRKTVTLEDITELAKKCPVCQIPLNKINYMYDSNIIIDRCASCNGMWVDEGEFKKIAIYSKEDPNVSAMGKRLLQLGKTQKVELEDPIVRFGNLMSQPAGHYWAFLHLPRFFWPLEDDTETNIIPYGTLGIIALNTLVFLLFFIFNDNTKIFYNHYGLIPSTILSGKAYTSFISSMFIHAGLFHLIGNMVFLWIFADNVEEYLGLGDFIAFFLICGIWASILHILISPNSIIPTIGSSGAIAGIMGAYFYLFPHANIRTRFQFKEINVPAYVFIGSWILMQIYHGISSYGVETSVSYFAHIGGFFSGIFLIWLYENKIKPRLGAARY